MARPTDIPEQILEAVAVANKTGLTAEQMARILPRTARTLRIQARRLYDEGLLDRQFVYDDDGVGRYYYLLPLE